jgi:hypothetical protein
MPKRRTSISLGGGLLLALTLALSGCGGGADKEPSDTVGGDTAQAEARAAAAPAPTDSACPGPAPQPFATLDPKNNSQPWSEVTAYLQANALASDSVTGQVKLCKGCSRIPATLRPLANTCAISSENGQTWMMGRIVANAALAGANQGMFGNDNDSSRVYLVVKSYPGTKAGTTYDSTFVIYPRKTPNNPNLVIGYVRGVQSSPRWNFMKCDDTKHGNAEWGKYKEGSKPVCGDMTMAADARMGDSVADVEPGDDDTTLTYGWMTCIGGCCRFYGPQPPNPRPETGKPEETGRPEEPGRPEKRP